MHYIGCDVSKAKLDLCLLNDQTGVSSDVITRSNSRNKTVANTPDGILELIAWLARQGINDLLSVHIAMEGTGVYHHTAAFELSNQGFIVSVCNPAQTKNYGRGMGIRNKTDSIDSFVLACFCKNAKPRKWLPPAPEAYALKLLNSRLDILTVDLVREKNRAEKLSVIRAPEALMQSIYEAIDFLTFQIEKLQKNIDEHIQKHEHLKNDMRLLTSIPSIGKRVGAAMLSVLHCNSFDSAEQLASFLGLVPVEKQSGTSLLTKSRMSRQGPPRIRALLYMASVCAIRKNGNPPAREMYERLLKKGKPKKAALGAVMRKLAHYCYGVFHTKTPFDVGHATNAAAKFVK